MIMIFILGLVIVLTCAVVGILYFMMQKESQKLTSEKVVPITDLSIFKKSLDLKSKPAFSSFPVNAPIPKPSTLDEELLTAKKRLAELEKDKPVEPLPLKPSTFASMDEGLKLVDPLATIKDESNVQQGQDKNQSSGPEMLEPKYDEGFYKSRITQLEEELRMVNDRSVSQAQEALEMINALNSEIEKLKAEKQNNQISLKEESVESQEKFQALQKEHQFAQSQIGMAGTRMREMENQINVIKKELGTELLDANATIEKLKLENQAVVEESRKTARNDQDAELTKIKDEFKKQNDELLVSLNDLKTRNTEILDSKKELEAKVENFNQERQAKFDEWLKENNDLKNDLKALTERLTQLNHQKDSLIQENEKLSRESETYIQEKSLWAQERDEWNLQKTESLQEKIAWDQTKTKLEENEKSLRETNVNLTDKIQAMQLELTRARAQASGLEKICANLKVQIEHLTAKSG